MGLDVHDASDPNAPLEAGMVITIEPGIYIPEENIGVRIEDMVLVTEHGAKVLSAALPREARRDREGDWKEYAPVAPSKYRISRACWRWPCHRDRRELDGAGDSIDNYVYDWIFRLYSRRRGRPQSIVLAIDERSFQRFGGVAGLAPGSGRRAGADRAGRAQSGGRRRHSGGRRGPTEDDKRLEAAIRRDTQSRSGHATWLARRLGGSAARFLRRAAAGRPRPAGPRSGLPQIALEKAARDTTAAGRSRSKRFA